MASSLGTPLPRWYIVHLANVYSIVNRLEALFPDRKFTPDGHLVGSIGEVVAAYMFALKLLPAGAPDHDAEASDGRRVQIKFTQGNKSVGIRAEPEQLLVLRLTPERNVDVVYNGPGRAPWSEPGKVQSNGQKSIPLKRLRESRGDLKGHGGSRIVRVTDITLLQSDLGSILPANAHSVILGPSDRQDGDSNSPVAAPSQLPTSPTETNTPAPSVGNNLTAELSGFRLPLTPTSREGGR